MSALHELVAAYMGALAEVDPETGEVPEDVSARMDAINADLQTKCEAIAAVRARLLADAEANSKLAKHYSARSSSLERQAERLEAYVEAQLKTAGIARVTAPTATVWLQPSKHVEVDDPTALPERFVRVIPAEHKPDKKAIGDAIKAGEDVQGARLVTEQHVRFK